MGVASSISPNTRTNADHAFLIERIVGSMCDFCSPPTLMMGVYDNKHDVNNPYGGLGLRIGDQPVLELRDYAKSENSIKYEFEHDTTLHFFRTDLNEIAYRLKTPTLDEIRVVDPLLTQSFKTIGTDSSRPLDEFAEILR